MKFYCKNPQHPLWVPRDKEMKVLEDNEYRMIVACVPCRDLYGVAAAQLITKPRGWERARHAPCMDEGRRQGSGS